MEGDPTPPEISHGSTMVLSCSALLPNQYNRVRSIVLLALRHESCCCEHLSLDRFFLITRCRAFREAKIASCVSTRHRIPFLTSSLATNSEKVIVRKLCLTSRSWILFISLYPCCYEYSRIRYSMFVSWYVRPHNSPTAAVS